MPTGVQMAHHEFVEAHRDIGAHDGGGASDHSVVAAPGLDVCDGIVKCQQGRRACCRAQHGCEYRSGVLLKVLTSVDAELAAAWQC